MDEEKWIAWEIQTSKKWSDMEDVLKYINIDFIDYDHVQLMEYALKLNQVMEKSEKEFSMSLINETKVLLDSLYVYAQQHFSREERFMDLYNLPGIEMHKREHKKILTMLSDAICDFNTGKSKLTRKLKSQVMDWLIKHINIVDYDFFAISNWNPIIRNASDWDEVKQIIRLTGIAEIDNQHEKLIVIIINAMQSIRINPVIEVIELACKQIIDYTMVHFNYEVQFIEKYKIKETEKHLIDHDSFIEKMNNYLVEIKLNLGKLEEMKSWILTWWINHINSSDKETFAYSNWAYQLMEESQNLEDVLVVLRRTGIEDIDNDHLNLIRLTMNLNTLITDSEKSIENGSNEKIIRQDVIALLDKTYACAAAHFNREEKMMEEHHMDDFISHQVEHKKILEKLMKIKENYQSGRMYLSSNIKTMILEWWINHTNTTDYRTFVQHYKSIADIKQTD